MNKQVKGKVFLGGGSALIKFTNKTDFNMFVTSLLRGEFEFKCNTSLMEVVLYGEKV